MIPSSLQSTTRAVASLLFSILKLQFCRLNNGAIRSNTTGSPWWEKSVWVLLYTTVWLPVQLLLICGLYIHREIRSFVASDRDSHSITEWKWRRAENRVVLTHEGCSVVSWQPLQQSLGVVDSRVEGGVRRDPLPVEILSSERTTMTAVKYNSQLVPVGLSVCLSYLPLITPSGFNIGTILKMNLSRSRSASRLVLNKYRIVPV